MHSIEDIVGDAFFFVGLAKQNSGLVQEPNMLCDIIGACCVIRTNSKYQIARYVWKRQKRRKTESENSLLRH